MLAAIKSARRLLREPRAEPRGLLRRDATVGQPAPHDHPSALHFASSRNASPSCLTSLTTVFDGASLNAL